MHKTFSRIISFEIQGEIYDEYTSPENIINSYDWRFKGFHDNHEDKCFLESSHDDSRGRITNMTKKLEIKKTDKPDTVLADLFSV
jgi:hypothetical protein